MARLSGPLAAAGFCCALAACALIVSTPAGGQARRQHIAPRRHVTAMASLLAGPGAFQAIRERTDEKSEDEVQAINGAEPTGPRYRWLYTWPMHSPYGWDPLRSYDWSYGWWHAGLAHNVWPGW